MEAMPEVFDGKSVISESAKFQNTSVWSQYMYRCYIAACLATSNFVHEQKDVSHPEYTILSSVDSQIHQKFPTMR